MGPSGIPYSDNELLIMLRQRMRIIGGDLSGMEMNSHLAALHINTWETLSDFLSKAIQLKPTETSHALTQSLHALTLHRPQQTQNYRPQQTQNYRQKVQRQC
jgi:hypothetical protein